MSISVRVSFLVLISVLLPMSVAIAQGDKVRAVGDIKTELAEIEKKLADLRVQAKVNAKAADEKDATARKEYDAAVAQAQARYKEAKNQLDEQAKKAGVDGFAGLFPDKRKAEILKSIDQERKRIEAERSEAIAKARARYEQAIAQSKAQAKTDKKQADREEAELKKQRTRLNAEMKTARKSGETVKKAQAKTRARDIHDKKAQLRKEYREEAAERKLKSKALAEAKKKEKAQARARKKVEAQERKRADAEYKKVKAEVKQELARAKEKLKADLKANRKSLVESKTDRGSQIRAEYDQAVAQAKLKLKLAKVRGTHPGFELFEDTSPRFIVKEIRVGGNSLIPTEQLLKDLPVAYPVSEEDPEKGAVERLYDFRVFHEILLNPDFPSKLVQNN